MATEASTVPASPTSSHTLPISTSSTPVDSHSNRPSNMPNFDELHRRNEEKLKEAKEKNKKEIVIQPFNLSSNKSKKQSSNTSTSDNPPPPPSPLSARSRQPPTPRGMSTTAKEGNLSNNKAAVPQSAEKSKSSMPPPSITPSKRLPDAVKRFLSNPQINQNTPSSLRKPPRTPSASNAAFAASMHHNVRVTPLTKGVGINEIKRTPTTPQHDIKRLMRGEDIDKDNNHHHFNNENGANNDDPFMVDPQSMAELTNSSEPPEWINDCAVGNVQYAIRLSCGGIPSSSMKEGEVGRRATISPLDVYIDPRRKSVSGTDLKNDQQYKPLRS